MPTNLISIGRSGAAAARANLELTAQNIANAKTPDYVRRSLNVSELTTTGTINFATFTRYNGVSIDGVQRGSSELLQRQARESVSDLASAEAEIAGLRDAETALETSGLFRGLVDFEAALNVLESDPTDPALRAGAIESARQLAVTFQQADASLATARSLVEDEIAVGVEAANSSAAEIARINQELTNSRGNSEGRAALLDARDAALRDLSEEFGTVATFDDLGRAEVRLQANPPPAGQSGVLVVSGLTANTISSSTAADGTTSFDVDGTQFSPVSGAMAGRASAIADIAGRQDELDTAALAAITVSNTAQANGVGLDGNTGQPLFSGSDASDITLALEDGNGLALAAAGSPAGSRDTTNLSAFVAAFGADDGPITTVDRSLLGLSSRIAGLDSTREGLSIINASAEAQLLQETGVDLDTEATNLIRLQQAFEANSRVIQVATELFDTILGLR